MDGSDDYFVDEIVLDEEAIAALDEEESKFVATQHPRPTIPQPPAKRQKTAHGWNPPPQASRSYSIEDLDLPEISVKDGFYGLRGLSQRSASQRSVSSAATSSSSNAVAGPSVSRTHHVPPAAVPKPPAPLSRANSNHSRPRSAGANQRAPSLGLSNSSSYQRLYRQPSRSFVNSQHAPEPQQQPSAASVQPAMGQGVDSQRLQQELIALRNQLEELQRSHSDAQSMLNEAINTKRAKAGEVVILRQNMEKAAQAHIAEQAKLRAAKEAAEAMQTQIQKEMKEEMERIKTQFTFKQHELETSMRKPPWTGRPAAKKSGRDTPSIPAPMPSQMRHWDQPDASTSAAATSVAGPSTRAKQTPSRPRFGTLAPDSPQAQRRAKQLQQQPPPPPAKKNAMLPDFVNTFASPERRRGTQGTGQQSPLKGKNKGKGRERTLFDQSQLDLDATGLPPPSPPSSPIRPKLRSQKVGEDRMEIEDDEREIAGDVTMDPDVSFDMDIDADLSDGQKGSPIAEDFDTAEAPDWIGRLHQIIFTHTLPSSRTNTFQTLLSQSAFPTEDAAAYSRASSRVLDALGSSTMSTDFDTLSRTVSAALVQMAHLLQSHSHIRPLTALLNFLTTLMISLPNFVASLLSPAHDRFSKHTPTVLTILCRIVPAHLLPTNMQEKEPESAAFVELAKEVVNFLDATCWSIHSDYEPQLAAVPRAVGVLSTFFDAAQPTWFLRSTTRLFAFFATRTNIFRHLLAFPKGNDSGDDQAKNYNKLPHIECMCALLLDTDRIGPEADSMKSSILTAFMLLAMSHTDALTILTESQSLIPSLVVFLTYLTTPLWEEDEILMSSPSLIARTIRTITQTLLLIQYLVFRSEPTLNLRLKLHHAPHRLFNGIAHMFVVTLGRLSFAEAPTQVGSEGRLKLERLAEVARDVMDLVVDGPESDSVWAVYQGPPERESALDDEEMEARILDAN